MTASYSFTPLPDKVKGNSQTRIALTCATGLSGCFIVDTDAHEVVAFGGPFPFYAFPSTFDSGETIRLGMTYSWDAGAGQGWMVYSADGVRSPALPFANPEKGMIDGSTLGGCFQIVNDPSNLNNSGAAAFANIVIVPEPLAPPLALLALGILPIWRRCRA